METLDYEGGGWGNVNLKTDNPREFIEALEEWLGEFLDWEIERGKRLTLYRAVGLADWEGNWEYNGRCRVELSGRRGSAEVIDGAGEGIVEKVKYENGELVVVFRM